MGAPLLATPNYLLGTTQNPSTLSGGNWETLNSLENLKNKFLINQAISRDLLTSSTRLHVNFGVLRDIFLVAINNLNTSNKALVRIQGSATPAWTTLLVDGVNTVTSTTLDVQTTTNVRIREGVTFKINGDSTIYRVDSDLNLGTNEFQFTEELDNAIWTKTGATILLNNIIAPDGKTSAERITEDTSTGNHGISQTVTITDGQVVTYSIFVRLDNREFLRLQVIDRSGAEKNAWFDLQNGIVNDVDSGITATINPTANGFFRCKVTLNVGTGGSDPIFSLFMALVQNGTGYTGDNFGGVNAWGAQLTTTSSILDYVRRDSAALTSSGTITIRQDSSDPIVGLAITTAGGENLTPQSGNFVDVALFSTGLIEYFGEQFERSSLFPWGVEGIWDGKPSEEQRELRNLPSSLIIPTKELVLSQYWSIELDDPDNTDGFLKIDDIFVASGWTPTNRMAVGLVQTLVSNTTVERSVGGVAVYNEEQSQREITFNVNITQIGEIFNNLWDIQRSLDTSKPLWVITDIDDVELMTRRAFLATHKQLSGITYPFPNATNTRIQLMEKLG